MNKRISESELILPSLLLLKKSPKGRITTSDLIDGLRELLKPDGEDLKILPGRQDDKFSQKVRNLVSHNTLKREKVGNAKGGYLYINNAGYSYLQKKQDLVQYLTTNDFSWDDLKNNLRDVEANKNKNVDVFDENIMINEGYKKTIEVKIYQRSSKLRSAAIQHYKSTNRLYCQCCSFNFSKFYGNQIGDDFIEMHHVKPIFKYDEIELTKFINDAIKNIVPVCSNCHRMIHKVWKHPLSVKKIRNCIAKNGYYGKYRISVL